MLNIDESATVVNLVEVFASWTDLSFVAVDQERVVALIKDKFLNPVDGLLRGIHIGILICNNMNLLVIDPIFLDELQILGWAFFINKSAIGSQLLRSAKWRIVKTNMIVLRLNFARALRWGCRGKLLRYTPPTTSAKFVGSPSPWGVGGRLFSRSALFAKTASPVYPPRVSGVQGQQVWAIVILILMRIHELGW